MKSLLITFCLLASHAILPGALADSLKIEFTTDDTFSIQVARVEVGDKVEWLPTNDGHNVEFLADPEKFLAQKNLISMHITLWPLQYQASTCIAAQPSATVGCSVS